MIEQIALRNFKAFKSHSFPVRPLTLLSGLNGSGKSSLIQVLLMLRQSFDAGSLKQNTVILNGPFAHLGTAQDVLNESASDENVAVAVTFSDSTSLNCELTFSDASTRLAQAAISGIISDSDPLFSSRFAFLSADRIVPQIHYGVPDQIISGRLGVRGEWTVNFLYEQGASNISILGAAHPAARSLQLAHQVEAWMGEISPGVQIHLEPQSGLDLIGLSYSFVARRDVSKRFRPTNVGFGVTYALPVVTAVLSSKPGDLVLIDSPEAHLHPRGQGKMAELFSLAAAEGVQLIVESHSDHVLNGIRLAVHDGIIPPEEVALLYFRWDAQNNPLSTTAARVLLDRNGRIEAWPEGFFDEFDRSLEALLGPGK
jgi:predicted ATPase